MRCRRTSSARATGSRASRRSRPEGGAMASLDSLRESLPEAARDLKINLQSVLGVESLTPPQRWGVAVASAFASRNPELRDAVIEEARAAGVDDAVIDDARAAAALMAMNNVFYRSRHMLGEA